MICKPPLAGIRNLAGTVVTAFQEGSVSITTSPVCGAGTSVLSSRVTQPLTDPLSVTLPLMQQMPHFLVTVIFPAVDTPPPKSS